jgi:predicted NBD/HSP70 family sugar kinase
MSGKNVGGIGISCSRWLKPPLSEYEIYSYIFDALADKFKLPVYKETPINTLLYKIKNANLYEDNIAIIHPGHILEVGIMCNNIIPGNISEIEHKFQHLPVNPTGNRCYCGQIGCLENEIAKENVLVDYNNIPGVEKIDNIGTFLNHVANGDKHAAAIIKSWGKVMAQGLLSLQNEHNLTKIYFCTNNNSLFFKETKKQLENIISGRCILEKFPLNRKSEPKAAGNMASYLTIKHYNLLEK